MRKLCSLLLFIYLYIFFTLLLGSSQTDFRAVPIISTELHNSFHTIFHVLWNR